MQSSKKMIGLVSVVAVVAISAVVGVRLGGRATGGDGSTPAGCGGGGGAGTTTTTLLVSGEVAPGAPMGAAQGPGTAQQADPALANYKPYIDAARAALASEITAAHVAPESVVFAEVEDDNAGTIRVLFLQHQSQRLVLGAEAVVELDTDQTVKSKVARFTDPSGLAAAAIKVRPTDAQDAARKALGCETCAEKCEKCIDRGAEVVATAWQVIDDKPAYRITVIGLDRDGATVERTCVVDILGTPTCPVAVNGAAVALPLPPPPLTMSRARPN